MAAFGLEGALPACCLWLYTMTLQEAKQMIFEASSMEATCTQNSVMSGPAVLAVRQYTLELS